MSRLVKILLIAVLLIGASSVAAQEATEVPTPEAGILSAEEIEALPVLIAARGDLELLATTVIGSAQRPIGWNGSLDVNNPQLPLLIRLDLEVLAGSVMGEDKRPAGWFGVVPSVPLAVARDIRHDLELLADTVIGAGGVRPAGWKGDDPIMRCSRATQSLFAVLQNAGVGLQVDFAQPNACDALETAEALYVERQILQPPVTAASAPAHQEHYPFRVNSTFVVAFLDRSARDKIGVLPVGAGFEAIGRSSSEFSNMMLVRGDNFQVYVDYTTTMVTNEEFLALPTMGFGSATNCGASWCGQGLN